MMGYSEFPGAEFDRYLVSREEPRSLLPDIEVEPEPEEEEDKNER